MSFGVKPICPSCAHGVFRHNPSADTISCDKCGLGFPVRDFLMCKSQADFNMLYSRASKQQGAIILGNSIKIQETTNTDIFKFYEDKK